MNVHTTFAGRIGDRMERFCDRWMRLTNRAQPPKSIERSQQLCRKLDLACQISYSNGSGHVKDKRLAAER